MQGKVYLKEGQAVAHKGNIKQKMFITKVIRRKAIDEERSLVNGEVKKTHKDILKIEGIDCHWFDELGEFKSHIFHSKLLIPWDIAEQGEDKVIDYLNNN